MLKGLRLTAVVFCVLSMFAHAAFTPETLVAGTGMEVLNEEEMSFHVGQALILSDKINPNQLTGRLGGLASCTPSVGNPCGTGRSPTDYTFYRMGIDAMLGMNMNIAKMQLGCGGINEAIRTNSCDIDLDYVRFMGAGTGVNSDRPAGYGAGAGSTAGVDSEFLLTKPYLEFAVKNDGSPTLREVVGIKIGAAEAKGALSVGRVYSPGQYNLENGAHGATSGGTFNPGPANGICGDAALGNAPLACNSGINSVSGFLGAELSIKVPSMLARVNVLGIVVNMNATACGGRLTISTSGCGSYTGDPIYLDASGTRMTNLSMQGAGLSYSGDGVVAVLDFLNIDKIYASMNANLRLVHFMTMDTNDFFLSLQREQVAYPGYNKVPFHQTLPAGNPQWDACGIGSGRPARCNSAYAVPANTGWWMNVPTVKLLNVNPGTLDLRPQGDLGLGEALGLLGPPGLTLDNPNFRLEATSNCFGNAMFC